MENKLFVDTWRWLTLLDKREKAHKTAVEYTEAFSDLNGKSYTTDYILDETITLLFRRTFFEKAKESVDGIFDMIKSGDLFLERISLSRFQKAWDLKAKYSDKKEISFTDFTSFVVMSEFGIREALTEDEHFEKVNLNFKRVP
jgi:predicted nucleic acid-binding protein